MPFRAALSGINASGEELRVIGNNVAVQPNCIIESSVRRVSKSHEQNLPTYMQLQMVQRVHRSVQVFVSQVLPSNLDRVILVLPIVNLISRSMVVVSL